jgi:hypothetical protein
MYGNLMKYKNRSFFCTGWKACATRRFGLGSGLKIAGASRPFQISLMAWLFPEPGQNLAFLGMIHQTVNATGQG